MKKAILILLSILAFSCSKDDNPATEQQETFNITTESNSVMPLRYVIINTDLSLTQNSYIGSFGGQEIQLVKSSDNELVFSTPQVSSGNQLLELTIDDKKGSLNFEVSENIIQNSTETISTELINPINELNQNINDLISNNTFSQEVTNGLTSANQMLNDYLTKFNTLSEEEKTEVAKFYNANPFFTNDFLNLSARTMMNGNSDYDCFNVNSERVVLTTITVLGFVAALPHLNAAGPLGSITALVGFVSGVYAAHSIISASHELLINECLIPFEHALNDSFGNSDNFEINNDSFTNFSLTSKDRHIIASDIANSNAVVSFTLEKINVVKGKWQTLKNGVNNIISTTSNWFNSWFGSSTSDYELISYEFPNVPETSTETENDGESEFITIEDFPSDVNVEVNIASNNSIDLKLNADASTLPRTVTGKIKYDDGDFKSEDDFSVTITEQQLNYKLQIGNYNPDYTLISSIQTLENGDNLTVPNYMTQMVRLTLDDIPVAVGQNSLEWTQYDFGSIPNSSNDINENNYSITIFDATNNRNVTLDLNLTLTNNAYSRVSGNQISCDYRTNDVSVLGPITIVFSDNGTYSKTYSDGTDAGSGNYSFVSVIAQSNQECDTYTITQPKAGCIYLPSESGNVFIPNYIYIYEDNNLGANSFYGCMDGYQTWHIN